MDPFIQLINPVKTPSEPSGQVESDDRSGVRSPGESSSRASFRDSMKAAAEQKAERKNKIAERNADNKARDDKGELKTPKPRDEGQATKATARPERVAEGKRDGRPQIVESKDKQAGENLSEASINNFHQGSRVNGEDGRGSYGLQMESVAAKLTAGLPGAEADGHNFIWNSTEAGESFPSLDGAPLDRGELASASGLIFPLEAFALTMTGNAMSGNAMSATGPELKPQKVGIDVFAAERATPALPSLALTGTAMPGSGLQFNIGVSALAASPEKLLPQVEGELEPGTLRQQGTLRPSGLPRQWLMEGENTSILEKVQAMTNSEKLFSSEPSVGKTEPVNNLAIPKVLEFKPTLENGGAPLKNISMAALKTDLQMLSEEPLNLSQEKFSALKNLPSLEANSFIHHPNSLNSGIGRMEARINMPVSISFGQPQWAAQVAERAASLASQNIRFAELQLDPPELGSLQVKVSVQNEQASVHFSSPHGSVRDALDQSVIRLRDLLEQQGLNLVDVNVSDQGGERQEHNESASPAPTDTQENRVMEEGERQTLNATYGVDFYA